MFVYREVYIVGKENLDPCSGHDVQTILLLLIFIYNLLFVSWILSVAGSCMNTQLSSSLSTCNRIINNSRLKMIIVLLTIVKQLSSSLST